MLVMGTEDLDKQIMKVLGYISLICNENGWNLDLKMTS